MNYLTAEEIIKINVMVIGRYSPKEPVGIADANSLQMIVEQAKQENSTQIFIAKQPFSG